MIKCHSLTKKFQSCIALDGIELSVPSGQFLAIVGESGSGKSTLLSLMSGLDSPTEGAVIINGKNLADFSEKETAEFRKNEIGFIFQQFFLEPNYTVFQNIAMPLILKKADKKETDLRVNEIARQIGLEDKLNSKAKFLSGGEMQRCCIARAFVKEPKYVFADEPCGNLDSRNGQIIIDLLKSYKQKGHTVILVTHNRAEAAQAERIIALEDGRITSDKHIAEE